MLIFYEGYGCIHCMEQHNTFAKKATDFSELGIDLVAISTDVPKDLKIALADYRRPAASGLPGQWSHRA